MDWQNIFSSHPTLFFRMIKKPKRLFLRSMTCDTIPVVDPPIFNQASAGDWIFFLYLFFIWRLDLMILMRANPLLSRWKEWALKVELPAAKSLRPAPFKKQLHNCYFLLHTTAITAADQFPKLNDNVSEVNNILYSVFSLCCAKKNACTLVRW